MVFAGVTRNAFNDAARVNVVVLSVVSHAQRWGIEGLSISNSTVGVLSISGITLSTACIVEVWFVCESHAY